MSLETKMAMSLLQALLLSLRANDAVSYKCWLALGMDELGKEVAAEVEPE